MRRWPRWIRAHDGHRTQHPLSLPFFRSQQMSPGETLYPKEPPQLFASLVFLRKETLESYYIAQKAHEAPRLSPCLDTDHLCSCGKSTVPSGVPLPLIHREEHKCHCGASLQGL